MTDIWTMCPNEQLRLSHKNWSFLYWILYEGRIIRPQVAQARNMSIGEHRHCCVTFENKDLYGKKPFRFFNPRKWKDFNKKQLNLLKMCVTSVLCGRRADLWPFYGFLCKRFSVYIKVYLNPLYRGKTVYRTTHKTAINRPMDHTGEM